jgi:hypothetical protein
MECLYSSFLTATAPESDVMNPSAKRSSNLIYNKFAKSFPLLMQSPARRGLAFIPQQSLL